MSRDKQQTRRKLRAARRDHVRALEPATRALLFLRPPRALLDMVRPAVTIGLYSAAADEAPTAGYARFFAEQGHALALPRHSGRAAPMQFAQWTDPFSGSDLEAGPFATAQPRSDAPLRRPDVLFVPLLGFTAAGQRIGQGGGHYDRYLAANPHLMAIGLAWDVQLAESLPVEEHDIPLHAVVTPTRLFGPF